MHNRNRTGRIPARDLRPVSQTESALCTPLQRSLRIVHVLPAMTIGGAESQVLHLCRAGNRIGDDVQVLVLGPNQPGDSTPFLRVRWRMLPFQLPRLMRTMRSLNADVVHCHMGTVVLGAPLARWARTPVVAYTMHGLVELENPVLRNGLFYSQRHVDLAFAVSDEVRHALAARFASRPAVLSAMPNGVPIPDLNELQAQRQAIRTSLSLSFHDRVAAFVGRLVPEKRVPQLIRAFARAAAGHPNWHLLVIGDGPERSAADGASREARATGASVTCIGPVPNAPEWIAASDVLAFFSSTEGLPLAALEAMAAARPVVASAVGELPALLGTHAGILVPPHDDDSLSAALYDLLSTPGRAAELGQAGRSLAQDQYSIERVYLRHRSAYLAVLSRKPTLCPNAPAT